LIGVWKGLLEGEKVFSPFGVLNFLEQREELLSKNRFTQTGLTQNPMNLLSAMQALVTHLIRATHDRVTLFLSQGVNFINVFRAHFPYEFLAPSQK